jgi:RND superfamily putative drug exporter
MQNLMLTFDRWLQKHRIGVLVAWIVLVVAAVPFAAKQSQHLSGGGYSIPGSDSQKLVARLPKIAPGAQHAVLAGVLAPNAGASAAEMRGALGKLESAAQSCGRPA